MLATKSSKQNLINIVLMCKTEKCLKIIVGKIMCKNNSWKIRTRGWFWKFGRARTGGGVV